MNANVSEQRSSRRWYVLGLLAVTLILSMTTWFSAAAVVPQLRQEWGLSASASAWLTIAVQLGFVFGALVSSLLNLADIISPKSVILSGIIGAAVVNWYLVLADSAIVVTALRFATGIFLAGVYPPILKLMSTWFDQDRGVALGLLVGAIVLGQAMPHLVNGLGGLDWRVVIHTTSLLTLVGGVITVLAVKEGPFPFPKARFDPAQMWRVFTNRGVRLASLGYFGHMWELFAMYAWFLLFFSKALQANGVAVDSSVSYATYAVIAIGALGCWVGGILGDRWGRTRTTALMMGVSGSCCLIIGFLFNAPVWLLLLVAFVWGFSVVADSAQFAVMVTELADQAYVGTALTLQFAVGFILSVATIWLIPLSAEIIGWQWVFVLLAPGPILGMVAMLRLKSMPESVRLAGGIG
jgi:MFS family permease